jgi:hypothetical protein
LIKDWCLDTDPELTPEQQEVVFDLARSAAPLNTVLGGPGCMKTCTVSKLVALLNLHDAKVLVLAKTSNAVDNFMTAYEKQRHLLSKLVANSRQQDVHSRPATEAATFDNIVKILQKESCVRFAPATAEDILVESSGLAAASETDKINDYMSNIEGAMESLALGMNGSPNSSTLETKVQEHQEEQDILMDRWQALKTTLERSKARSHQKLAFPANHAMDSHIEHLKKGAKWSDESRTHATRAYKSALARLEILKVLADEQSRQILATIGLDFLEILVDDQDRVVAMANARAWLLEVQKSVLGEATIVGTTYLNSQHPALSNFEPDVIIHEEANQTTIAEGLSSFKFTSAKAHIALGDSQHMIPTPISNRVSEARDMDSFSWLQLLLNSRIKPIRLIQQYRMDPTISRFPNQEFYAGQLEDARLTREDTPHKQICRRVVRSIFADRQKTDSQPQWTSQYFVVSNVHGISIWEEHGTSVYNTAEALCIVEVILGLLKEGISGSKITALCYYKAQARAIRSLLNQGLVSTADRTMDDDAPQILSVDACQGHENDVVLVASSVSLHNGAGFKQPSDTPRRGDDQQKLHLSSFARNVDRLIVATTRAKNLCVVFGHWPSIIRASRVSEDGRLGALNNMVADAVLRKVHLVDRTMPGDLELLQFFEEDPVNRVRYIEDSQHGASFRGIQMVERKRRGLTLLDDPAHFFGIGLPPDLEWVFNRNTDNSAEDAEPLEVGQNSG